MTHEELYSGNEVRRTCSEVQKSAFTTFSAKDMLTERKQGRSFQKRVTQLLTTVTAQELKFPQLRKGQTALETERLRLPPLTDVLSAVPNKHGRCLVHMVAVSGAADNEVRPQSEP